MASARQLVRSGRNDLVVLGKSKAGFRLAARNGAGEMTPFGPLHDRQKDALEAGKNKFGLTPKVVRKAA